MIDKSIYSRYIRTLIFIKLQRVALNGKELDVEVARSGEINKIIKKFHDMVGHPGINSTYAAIKQRFICKGMFTDQGRI